MAETLYQVANTFVLPFWLALALWPTHKVTNAIVHRHLPQAGLAFLYGVFLVVGLSADAPGGGFGSLAELAVLFGQPEALLAGWLHYLAFDLFVGAWEARDAAERGISKWLVAPCLFFTLMAGPLGLLLYLGLRLVAGKEPTPASAPVAP